MTIKKTFSALLFFCLFFISNQSALATPQQLIDVKLANLLNHFTTFQADFTQRTLDANQQIIQKSEGRVQLMRPNYFRWESKLPTHQIVIANGKTLWIYDVDLKQVTQQSVQQGPMSPAKLLAGHVHNTLQQFNVMMAVHGNTVIFQLIPKKANQQFRVITMTFSNDELRSMQIKNTMQQTNVFQFSRVKMNGSLSRSLFEFKVPAGVDVLH